MNKLILKIALAALICLLLPSLASAANEKIGMVLSTSGEVHAKQQQDSPRLLKRRAPIYLQDTITAGANSRAQVRLEDGTLLSINPNTEFMIEAFKFDKKTAKREKFVGKLVKGTLVSLSGQGKASDYQLKGPVTAITLRGTGVVFRVLENRENVGLFEGVINVQSVCPKGKDQRACQRQMKVLSNVKHDKYQTIEVSPSGSINPYKGALIEPIPIPKGTYYDINQKRMEMLRSVYDMLQPKPVETPAQE